VFSSYRYIFNSKNAWPLLAIICFLLSFIPIIFSSQKSSVKKELLNLQEHLNDQQVDFYQKTSNTAFIQKVVDESESNQVFQALSEIGYGFFLQSHDAGKDIKISFWNTQQIAPTENIIQLPEGEYFKKLPNGYYVVIKKDLQLKNKENRVTAIAMLPVFYEYYIETDYLTPEFSNTNKKSNIELSFEKTDYAVRSITGKLLFYLKSKTKVEAQKLPFATLILRILSIFFLLGFIHKYAEWVSIKKGALSGIGFLILSLLIVQAVIYFSPSTLSLRQFELFNPAIYGYNAILKSLGHLLINAAIICWIILFIWSKYKNKVLEAEISSSNKNKLIASSLLFLLILVTLYISAIIKSLVLDSKISFDVTNFFSLSIYTVIGIVILVSLALSYFYFSKLILHFVLRVFQNNFLHVLLLISLIGLLFFTLINTHPDLPFYILVLIWILIFTTLLIRENLTMRLNKLNLISIIFWIFFFSVSISMVILSENKEKEWALRINIAEKLALQTDPSSERLLSIALTYIDNDFLSENFERFKNVSKGKYLRDSIIYENFSGYLNKYDTRLYVFNKNDAGLNNDDPTTYNSLNTILQNQAKKTKVSGLYYYETSFDQFAYITKREVFDENRREMGTVFIISTPKKYRSDALFPVLFKQMKKNDPEESSIYSYAIYNKKTLISPFNKYPFLNSLTDSDLPKFEVEKRVRNNYDELWYRASNDKVVVVVRKQDSLIETVTLFSYIFCAFLLIVIFLQFLNFLFRTKFNKASLISLFNLNIRAQVLGTIILITLFSFIVIGIATISFFIKRYNQNNSERLGRSMRVMVNELQNKLSDHATFDDVLKVYDTVANYQLQLLIDEVSEIHNADVNIYDLNGDLQLSSQSAIYSKGVLSRKMNPTAFYHLSNLREVRHLQEEKVGKLTYLSIYAPVRDSEGQIYAYLNIPYFTSQNDLNQEISNFLVTIINLNAFIFLVAALLALLIANRITGSFTIISNKMKSINLGSLNEEVEWKRDDEIGVLIKEYNKMVRKLEVSASELAKSERESAWREMARQVAHEIKNPLTPMKLSIQYLQKAMAEDQLNVKELTKNVSKTLVEQIDHLSKIAADFSQFANISIAKKERFDLLLVINSLKELYASNPKVDIEWSPSADSIMLDADKTQINRLFTNLLSNSVEACRNKSHCEIRIKAEVGTDKVLITVSDNGEGIPAEMKEKIFTPNFTTKSSGTGLGLAMCKTIAGQAKGKIWFAIS
jgi:two-component system, NtrC family, nitrogen regulation sensor histidine kinase NtrY